MRTLRTGLSKGQFMLKVKPVKIYGEYFRQLVDGRNGRSGKTLANKLVKSGRLNVRMTKEAMWKEYKKGKPIYVTGAIIKTAAGLRNFVYDVYTLGA